MNVKQRVKNKSKIQVLTPHGWSNFSGVKRVKSKLYKISLEERDVYVTKDHPFTVLKDNVEHTCPLSELNIGDRLQSKNGYTTILDIQPDKTDWAYDLLDVERGSIYYTDSILSHNCFLESGRSAIDGDLLTSFRENAKPPEMVLMDGTYSIFVQPKEGHIYTIGVDVGEGIGQAASVAQIFDITDLTNIEQTAIYHNNTVDPFHFATVLHEIVHQWGRPNILIERNNCGGTVIDTLREVHHYENIVDYTPENQKYYNKLGVYSHSNAKYKGVVNMRYWINSLRAVTIYDLPTIQEMETFIRYPNGTWKKQKGEYIYDDRVLSMVWSLFILEPELTERYFEIADWDENGKPAKLKSINVEAPEYYKLDPFYQNNSSTVMPVFWDASPEDEDDITALQQQGWRLPQDF